MSLLKPITNTPATVAPARVWSSLQQAIFRALCFGSGNIVVEAVAGSGKSTTMIQGLREWQEMPENRGKRAIFLAFNKAIAEELKTKVPRGVDAKTLHGACYGAVMRAFASISVNDRKLHTHIDKLLLAAEIEGDETKKAVAGDLSKVYGLLKGTLTSLTDLGAVQTTLDQYGVSLDAAATSLPLLADLDSKMREDVLFLTFDEMVSFVVDHNIRLPKYDLVMVDEAQDMNRLQLEILKRLLSPTGRLVAVGDTYQSIYGFRGADAEAMGRIREEFNVSTGNCLPLSITYRCPKAVVAVAQEWVPHIQAAETAPEGAVIECSGKQMPETMLSLRDRDMVVCHCNAPLVSAALKLIAKGRKAVVRGRDIGKSIEKLVTKLAKHLDDKDVAGLAQNVAEYQETEIAKMMRAQREAQAQQVEDRCATIFALLAGARTIQALMTRIETLFSDNSHGVVFSSIHKSKGLEADTIVWLGPELGGRFMARAKNAAAVQQIKNLCYVAVTRAKSTLVYQPIPDEKDEETEDVAFGSAR